MHFGTFCGSEDESKEPLVELINAIQSTQQEHEFTTLRESWKSVGGFGVIDIGETILLQIA